MVLCVNGRRQRHRKVKINNKNNSEYFFLLLIFIFFTPEENSSTQKLKQIFQFPAAGSAKSPRICFSFVSCCALHTLNLISNIIMN